MGRPTLNTLYAFVSTYFTTVEIQTIVGSHVIISDKHIGRECFIAERPEAENHLTKEKLKKGKNVQEFEPQGGF